MGILVSGLPAQDPACGAEPAADDRVVEIFVMRRPLDGPVLGSVKRFAHSALLLRTRRGHYYTLEYMNDSRAHMTAGRPKLMESATRRRAFVAMKGLVDGRPTDCRWECDLNGTPLVPQWSPAQLQQKMQSLMKPYSVWRREHCHTALERLQWELGVLR